MTLGRSVMWGTMIGAATGGVLGLVLGLIAYAPTTWFAVIELGIPGAVAGALAGLVLELLTIAMRRRRARHAATADRAHIARP